MDKATYYGEKALQRAAATKSCLEGMCLYHVRRYFGIPRKYDSAHDAWLHARNRHSGTPPRGAVVFWRSRSVSGQYGHIALSLGGGIVRSTDWPYAGHVSNAKISDISIKWGLDYDGWTWNLNDHGIWAPTVDLSNVAAVARKSKSKSGLQSVRGPVGVRRVEYSLYRRGLFPRFRVNRWWNKYTTRAYAAWQRRLGYSGSDADGVPGITSLRRLARLRPYRIVRK
jgi:hypothetical protein